MWLVAISGVTLLAGAVHSALGFGSGPLLVPVLLVQYEPAVAVVCALLVGMGVNLLQLVAERRHPRISVRRLRVLWIGAAPGCLAGALLAGELDATTLSVVVAVALVVSAIALILTPSRSITLPPAAMAVAGVATGASAALTGIFGPILGMILMAAGLREEELRDGLGASFLIVGAIAVCASLILTGEWSGLTLAGALMVPAAAGQVLGRRIAGRMQPRQQRRAVLLAVLMAAGVALARAAA